jgi:23S rRNA pseudouridine2457 synthase
MAIGRLDEDSEGFCCYGWDDEGKKSFAKKVEQREYYVQVDGVIHQEAIDKLKAGVEIGSMEPGTSLKCDASLITDSCFWSQR